MPIVLQGTAADYAPTVLLPGDPGRTRAIADLLDDPRQVTEHRGMLGFTGSYNGTPLSVQTTGMGTPSMAIIVEELLQLGCRRFVRVGTCGGIAHGMRTGDLVVATAAAPVDGATRSLLDGDPFAPVADFDLTARLVTASRAAGASPHIGPVATVDLLYNPAPDYPERWRARGILAVEMEAAVLFTLAGRAAAAGDAVAAACLLTVSDVLGGGATTEETYLPLDELEAATERMIRIALDGATA